ncbi:two-component system sensor histidine kinase MnoS [Fodinicola feengrottensis]|uniref:Two-component system sensor histidine kinase MnoS n=1 Tax=Fodinicola feengrottensis TaxID=435914 RepID=A0ABP4SWY5_9ACTN
MPSGPLPEPPPVGIADLTGIRSSKPSFYAEYRSAAEHLNRSLASMETISSALVATGRGTEDLCRAVVSATAEHLSATWVVLALADRALPEAAPRFLGRDPAGELFVDRGRLPAAQRDRVWQLLRHGDELRPVVEDGDQITVLVPMVLEDHVQGVLAAWTFPSNGGRELVDRTDLAVLSVLANQTVVSLRAADLLSHSEALRRRTERLYREAARQTAELARGNRELREAQDRLLAANQQRAVDEERRWLARELHDRVAQHVLSAGMAVEWCRSEVPADSPVRAQLDRAKQLSQTAVEQLRSAIATLSAGEEDSERDLAGLLTRLEVLHSGADVDVAVKVEGRPLVLPAAAERSLFRIASECVFNTVVHSGAAHAVVRLVYQPQGVQLSVSDDGNGSPEVLRRVVRQQATGSSDGYHRGLANIAARVGELGGVLRFTRARMGGVRVQVEVPVPIEGDGDD